MEVTFLNEGSLLRKVGTLASYLKSKADTDTRYQNLLQTFKEDKDEWSFVYPDRSTPSDWFQLADDSIVIGCCDEIGAYPIHGGYPFTFAVLCVDYYDPSEKAWLKWASTNYPITIYNDVCDSDGRFWTTKELQKSATALAKKLTRTYANKNFANYRVLKNFLDTAPIYSMKRTGDPLTSLRQKPTADQKITIKKLNSWTGKPEA